MGVDVNKVRLHKNIVSVATKSIHFSLYHLLTNEIQKIIYALDLSLAGQKDYANKLTNLILYPTEEARNQISVES